MISFREKSINGRRETFFIANKAALINERNENQSLWKASMTLVGFVELLQFPSAKLHLQ